MRRVLKSLSGITVIAVLGAVTVYSPAPARAQAAQSQKKVKDQGEYDLFNAVTKEQDPNKKLQLLDQWKQKYPDSDFKVDRLQIYIQTYQKLGQTSKILDTAKEILATDPKEVQALYWITFLTPTAGNNSPEALDTGEKAANGLLHAEKPANVKDDAWATAKNGFDALAYKTLGWIAWQRKNYEEAEKHFSQSLKIDPKAADISYWWGTVILAEKKPERQADALYQFARASAYDGPGSLNAQGRQQVDAYLTKAYATYHGHDPQGLQQLKEMAKASPFPPPDFKIKTQQEVAVEKENELKQSNPALALWMGLKQQLTGPDGEKFFDGTMKGAEVPGGAGGVKKLKGTLIEAKPATRSKELIVGVSDPKVPEVTLKLDTPLAGKPELGAQIEFEGVPSAFTKDPFMVTFDTEQSKIEGLKVEKPAPVRRRPAPKKSASAKK